MLHKNPWFVFDFPVSPESVRVGRLVLDPKSPQDFYDPSKAASNRVPESERTEVKNPTLMLKSSNSIGLEAVLTSFAKAFFRTEGSQAHELTACQASQSLLLSANTWLETICCDDETRSWLEKQIRVRKRRVYMITGVRSLHDARTKGTKSHHVQSGGDLKAPALAAAGVPIPIPEMDLGGKALVDSSGEKSIAAEYPDERIYSLQYREVKMKAFNGDDVDLDVLLSTKTRWEEIWAFRGVDIDDGGAVLGVEISDSVTLPNGLKEAFGDDSMREESYWF